MSTRTLQSLTTTVHRRVFAAIGRRRSRRVHIALGLTAAFLCSTESRAQHPTGPTAAAESTEAKPSAAPGAWVDDRALVEAAGYTEGWLTHGGTYSEQRFSPLNEIDADNVSTLGLAWTYETGTRRGLEATPIVVDGVLYATGTWSVVYALDARTGEEKWRYDPEVPRAWGRNACCDVVNRGVALYDGKVFLGALDGRLIALDAGTGKLVWQVITVDQSLPYTITGAPRIVKGKVIIGNGGAEYGVRGYVSAYDAKTGDRVWRSYTVPGDPALGFESKALERAASTWNGEWWALGGGGTAWDSMAFDPALDLLYVGTGNGSPWNRNLRSPGGGDNLYLSSILALDPDTGDIVWHYQTTPGDSWDYTATQHIVLADLEIDGQQRQVLMQAPKNGFFFVLDRKTGQFLSAESYVPVNWASGIDEKGRPVELPTADYLEQPALIRPAALGGHNWQPMSFHPPTGLVFLPAQENAAAYAHDADFEPTPGAWNLGIIRPAEESEKARELGVNGFLQAWDPVAQKERWRADHGLFWSGGVLSTGGNLVFQGRPDGFLVAYRATDGQELWKSWAATGIMAAPVTYELEGRQYVTVVAGWGGAYGLARPDSAGSGLAQPGRILSFALGGGRSLGVDPAQTSISTARLARIASSASPEQIEQGSELYGAWCATCHGGGAVGGGVIPDLRLSGRRTFDAYADIVLEGALREQGMPSLEKHLDADAVEAIKGFVLNRRQALIDGP